MPPGNGRHTSNPAPSMAWCAATTVATGRAVAPVGIRAGDAGEYERVLDGHCGHGCLLVDERQPSCSRNYSAMRTDRRRQVPRRHRQAVEPAQDEPAVPRRGVGRRARAPGTAGSACRSPRGPRAGRARRRGSGGSPIRRPGAAPRRRGSRSRVVRHRLPTARDRGWRRPGTTSTKTPCVDGVGHRRRVGAVVTRRENCTGAVEAQQLVDRVRADRRVVAASVRAGRDCGAARACRCRSG